MYLLDTTFDYRNYILFTVHYKGISSLLYLFSNTIPLIIYVNSMFN